MNKKAVEIGQTYQGKAIGLKSPVQGVVLHKLENCVVLSVQQHEEVDAEIIAEKAKMVLARYHDLEQVSEKELIYE